MHTSSFSAVIFAAVILSGATRAEETELYNLEDVLEACDIEHAGQELSSCFGVAIDLCLARSPDSAATPLECWQKELAVWEQLMAQSYEALLQDLETRGYGAFKENVNAAQALWAKQSRLDCELEVMSNPRTYETIGIACLAGKLKDRTLFLRSLFGANWTDGR